MTARVPTATAAIGPALAINSAGRADRPIRMSSGFRPLRTQNRNSVDSTPITSVGMLVSPILATSVRTSSGIASPEAEMPKIDLSWLVAMMMPEAVMNPETTGCDRRLARKPSFRKPIRTRMRPDSSASTSVAAMNSALPGAATLLAAVRVMSEITATGPTARVRLVPNRA